MQNQKDHDKPENLVQSPHQETEEARSLEDEVDSHQSLEGYFAMNNIRDGEEVEAEKLKQQQDAERAKQKAPAE